jgi:hypothetical protein
MNKVNSQIILPTTFHKDNPNETYLNKKSFLTSQRSCDFKSYSSRGELFRTAKNDILTYLNPPLFYKNNPMKNYLKYSKKPKYLRDIIDCKQNPPMGNYSPQFGSIDRNRGCCII